MEEERKKLLNRTYFRKKLRSKVINKKHLINLILFNI